MIGARFLRKRISLFHSSDHLQRVQDEDLLTVRAYSHATLKNLEDEQTLSLSSMKVQSPHITTIAVSSSVGMEYFAS